MNLKKFFLGLALILLSVVAINYEAAARLVSGVLAHNHSSVSAGGGTLNLSGNLSSTKACATNYIRISPNLCLLSTAVSLTVLTRDACTSLSLPASDAKALLIDIELNTVSSNVIALRITQVSGYDDAACTTKLMDATLGSREEPAVVAGNVLNFHEGQYILSVLSGLPKLKMTDDVGNRGTGRFQIRGYFD